MLGLTSLLTDISSEMVTATLPLYLTFELGFSALQFGGYLALSEAVQAFMRIGGGIAADRRSGHKGLAVTGYAVSAFSRIGVLFAGGAWVPTTAVLLADRAAKGVRTAPRDAMVSLASPPSLLGRSFGVHRAMDAAGALAGPLLAFAILAISSEAFDSVFIVSFAFGLIGVAVIALFVPRTPRDVAPADGIRSALIRDVVRNSPIRCLTAATIVLGLTTIGDAFVFLAYRRVTNIGFEFFPLLFTGSAVVYLVLAIPVGRLADRVGRRLVFLAGYGSLALVYSSLLLDLSGATGLVVVVVGLGTFYAATDGVVMAAASELLHPSTRASGLAVVSTGGAVGRAVAVLAFGALWANFGPDVALKVFAVAVPVAMVAAWPLINFRVVSVSNESVALS
jgi:MFS family permease